VLNRCTRTDSYKQQQLLEQQPRQQAERAGYHARPQLKTGCDIPLNKAHCPDTARPQKKFGSWTGR
jgi:hypothetical protein